MGEELRAALEKHLFNYTWGVPGGGGSKVFPSTDIRRGDVPHKDFTLRAPNLKEALIKIERGNFAICPLEAPFVPSPEDPGKKDPKLVTASGCPPLFPYATRNLVKRAQKGGTGGEDDWTTFHGKAPWQIVFTHENESITWNLVQKARPSIKGNLKDGLNKAEASLSGSIHNGTVSDSPQQQFLKNPLKGGKKEKERIRRALKDGKVYLLGNPHRRREQGNGGDDSGEGTNGGGKNGNPKEGEDAGVETESHQEVSLSPQKVWRHWPFFIYSALYTF